jgi:hypothetical protein
MLLLNSITPVLLQAPNILLQGGLPEIFLSSSSTLGEVGIPSPLSRKRSYQLFMIHLYEEIK